MKVLTGSTVLRTQDHIKAAGVINKDLGLTLDQLLTDLPGDLLHRRGRLEVPLEEKVLVRRGYDSGHRLS